MNDRDPLLPPPAPEGDSLPFDAPLHEDPAAGGLDKIRELLFGREMETVERRFARLEARLAGDAAALREEVLTRLEALDAYVKDELGSLNAGLGQERRDREEAIERAAMEARTGRDALARRIADAKDANDQTAQVVRQRILDEATRAQNAIRTTGEEIQRALDKRTAQLDERKADRKALAALFSQAAARLDEGL
ncbi:MAG: hypothetical protein AAF791_08025 [Bacteroidota bacterium]